MNNHFFTFKTLIILFGTVLFFSCQQEENESTTQLEALQTKLKEDQSYQAFMEASTAIYTSTIENQIDWSGISDFMKENGLNDICDCATMRLKDIEGAIKYQEIHCNEWKPNLAKVFQMYGEELHSLNEFQIKKLFSYSSVISSTRASCLDALNAQLAAIPPYCLASTDPDDVEWNVMDCIDFETQLAYIGYDICICENYDYC